MKPNRPESNRIEPNRIEPNRIESNRKDDNFNGLVTGLYVQQLRHWLKCAALRRRRGSSRCTVGRYFLSGATVPYSIYTTTHVISKVRTVLHPSSCVDRSFVNV